ncbi:sterol desaturase family protein [Simiduia sp. 21SJ11W-1]|uniref:sterol desaturase family protein n=1 Tax=Simiduia sp. 21SJ11W-1 TaxID=2909669 RepID=UPI00209F6EC8|nr:sterol desaturase family protein [Simiduia sp. 21SJ11W-1]UTA48036.1 sterol desaturase family protein [Simiduia sp. 21SJ11W-1]
MRPELILIIAIYLAFAVVEAVRLGLFHKPEERPGDWQVELASTISLLLITQPGIILLVNFLGQAYFPTAGGLLHELHPVWQLAALLIIDDMSQYWWHRLSHQIPWLYKLHRPHHNAEYMSVRLVYRNNVFYYWMMPGIWGSAVLIYLGLGWVYAVYIVVKLTVTTGAHCAVPWDEKLYQIPALKHVMWLLERVISTPSTHSMHHGKHLADGITHYKGNYGNLLFLWDLLFGSARITRSRPKHFGVEGLADTTAAEQLFWPLVRSSASINEQVKRTASPTKR